MNSRDWSAFLVPVAVLSAAAPASHAMSYMTVAQAQVALFPGAKTFAEATLTLNDDQKDRIKSVSGMRQRWDTQKVWRAEQDGQLLGWFVVDDVVGKHDFITYAVAISPEGRVIGVEVMDYLLRRGAFANREEGLPAVLLLDIKMPRMDGLEVLRQIREHEELKRLPVVILSSSREESDLARSWDLGVNAYVVKPVDIDQFFQAVKTLGTFWAVINETPVGD